MHARSVTTDVPDQNQLLASVDKLAGDLRQKLSTDPKVVNDLKAHAARPTTNVGGRSAGV